MRQRKVFTFIIPFIVAAGIILSSCVPVAVMEQTEENPAGEMEAVNEANSPTATAATTSSADTEMIDSTEQGETTEPQQVEHTPTPSQAAANASSTPDLRRSPEDWRTWTVLPERVSTRAREIYQRGLAMGRDPHAFSVTGDCQAIRDVMLGEFDDPRKYHLKKDEQFLQESIDWFQGSFNRNGAAVRGGFNAASVLSPIHADPQTCKSGETPLGCEFRLHNPSILIISLEVWNDRAHLDRYELYLRQIIEYSIEEGVLPVLMTKADMAEALEHVINPLLVQLAYEYDLPLVNFWLAVQPLPNHGIDPGRDGFHISEEAWWVKSLTALKALDVVWRAVNQMEPAAATSTAQPTPTPEPSATAAAALPTPTAIPVCSPPVDCALFDFTQVEAGRTVNMGIYILDVPSGEIAQVVGTGFYLQDVSSDGSEMIAARNGSLYRMTVTGTDVKLISADLVDNGAQAAFWLGGDAIALMANRDGTPAIWLYTPGHETWLRVSGEDDHPIWLYPALDPDRVYWEAGDCSRQAECTAEGLWVTTLDGQSMPIEGVEQPVFSPDGEHFAFMDPEYTYTDQFDSNFRLVVEDLEERLLTRRVISFPAATGFQVRNRLESYAWSPDGSRIMIFLDERSNYYEKSAGYHTFLFHMEGGMMLEYDRLIGDAPRMAWAPDGQRVLFAITAAGKDGLFTPTLSILTPAARAVQTIELPEGWRGLEYRYFGQVFWLGE